MPRTFHRRNGIGVRLTFAYPIPSLRLSGVIHSPCLLSWRGQGQVFALILDYFYNFIFPSLLSFIFVSTLLSCSLSCPVCPFLPSVFIPLNNIIFRLILFSSSFPRNFVLYLCVFSLSLHCTFPSFPSSRCCFPITLSFACLSVSLVYFQSCFLISLLQFLLMTVSICHCMCLFPSIVVLLLSFPRSFPHSATFHDTFSTLRTTKLVSPSH